MKYSKYPSYRDSGVEWLGDIPEDWKPIRYKYILNIFQGNAFKSSDYVDYSNVINIRMGNIKKGGSLDLNHNLKYLPETYTQQYQDYRLKNGDVIIAMTDMSPSLEFLAVPATLEKLDPTKIYLLNQRVGKLRFNENIDSKYVKYSLLTYELREYFKSSGLGTVQANMSNDNLYQAFVSYPPIQEQQTIANYLDKATAKIDTLIEKQTKLIELLREKRQAVISTTVTRGLDNTVAMKDSGIEWLGEIPEHWKSYRIDWISTIVRGNTGFKKDELLSNGEYVALQYGKTYKVDEVNEAFNFYVNSEFYKLSQVTNLGDTILISTSETVEDLGHSCFYNRDDLGLIGGEQILLKPDTKFMFEKFLYYSSKMFSKELKKYSTGLKVFRFSIDDLKNIFISIPPIEEQQEIVNYIDDKTLKIDTLTVKATKAIDLLKEKRTALISAAVTGKIDVREIA